MSIRNSQTYDNLMLLKDAGAIVADGAATVGAVPRVVDVGPASMGRVKAVIDTSAIDTVTPGAAYAVAIQGSVNLAFTTPVELARKVITTVGREELPFSNLQNGVTLQFIRAFVDVGGTAPTINSTVAVYKD